MSDPVIEAANDILRRMELLDEGVANGRALIEEPTHRVLLSGDVAEAAAMARAAMLRSALGCAMAALDPPDFRDNRASLGQLIRALGDTTVAAELMRPVASGGPPSMTLAALQSEYDAVRGGATYARCRDLRNGAVAHFLLAPPPPAPTEYADVFAMQDEAERLTTELFAFCGGRRPRFPQQELRTRDRAKLFWDVFYAGISKAP